MKHGKPIAWLVAAALAAALIVALRAPRPPAPDATKAALARSWQREVAILQYLAQDYAVALGTHDAGELAEQESLAAEAVSLLPELGDAGARFASRLASLDEGIRARAEGAGVRDEALLLVEEFVAEGGIARAPRAVPDLASGADTFASECAKCHGPTGHGDGSVGLQLNPRPANFHDPERMGPMTPFKIFNTLRFGVRGTDMPPFEDLGEAERWSLAFYVLTLRQPECDHAPADVSLEVLANSTDDALAEAHADEVACLRRRLPARDTSAHLLAARKDVERALAELEQGDFAAAQTSLLDGYLDEIEPIEPVLRGQDAGLVHRIESGFTEARTAVARRDPDAQARARDLVRVLDRAASAPRASSGVWSAFGFTLLVIVREGIEAAVVIAALLAVLKKRKELAQAQVVHAGWIAALGAGALLFFFGRRLIAGARSEALEGILALVAVVMLLQAALWLNARATTRRTMGDLRAKASGAIERQSSVALFGIAFLAMFRETFETAVFLEALSLESPMGVLWGVGAGVAILAALVVGFGRVGVRLPLARLFDVSTVVLILTAVVLLGQGIHVMQTLGWVRTAPVGAFELDVLGIHGDLVGLGLQAALATGSALVLLLPRLRARGPEITRATPRA